MLLRAYLRIYRKRLITAAAVTLFLVLLEHMWVSADSIVDVGVFWHHFCGCPPEASDALVLLRSLNILAAFLGAMLGFNLVPNGTPMFNSRRFLFSRPVSRNAMQLYPLSIATAAIAILPVAAWAVLLGWLRLVHAPALAHLVAIAELVPAASRLGPHASPLQLLQALRFGHLYLAALSVGLACYAFFAAAGWFMVSPRPWLKKLAATPFLFLCTVNLMPREWNIMGAILLAGAKGSGLGYLPSALGIGLHLGVALLLLCALRLTLNEAEL